MVLGASLLVAVALGGAIGWAVGGVLGAVLGAVAGLLAWLLAVAAWVTPLARRASLYDRGYVLRGARWRGRLELWDLRAREITTVRGFVHPAVTVRRYDRRTTPPPAPRRPPYVPGVWPPTDPDPAPVRRAVARLAAYRAAASTVEDRRAARGR